MFLRDEGGTYSVRQLRWIAKFQMRQISIQARKIFCVISNRTWRIPGGDHFPVLRTIPRSTNIFYPSSTTLNTPSSDSPSGASTFSSHLITKQLALLALRLSTVYEERRGLVECSVVFFRQGVQEICAKEKHAKVGEEEVLSRNRSFISSLCDFRVLWIVIRISC